MEALMGALGAIPWYGWVAIVAIVCGTVVSVTRSRHKHHGG